MPRSSSGRLRPGALATLLTLALPGTALALPGRARADAVVLVTLRRSDGTPASGTVQLARGDDVHRCTTDAEGHCEMRGVAGGAYTVTVRQAGRRSPRARSVMVPPTGEVKLIVNAT